METKEIKETLENSPKRKKALKLAKLSNKLEIADVEKEISMIELNTKKQINLLSQMEEHKGKYSNSEKRDLAVQENLIVHDRYNMLIKHLDVLKTRIEEQDIEISFISDVINCTIAYAYLGANYD
jgi:hypothetical protein